MLEVIVFAVTLVAAQIVGGFITMKLVMNKRFLKKYTKAVYEMSMELVNEME